MNLPPLYPITDPSRPVRLSDQILRLGEAGFPLVQFRGKPLDAKTQWAELLRTLAASRERGGWPMVAVNDRADLAILAVREGLPPWGLHLGQEDLPPSEAHRIPGLESLHLGTSTHSASEWENPDTACDHAGVGPFRSTRSKAGHAPPIGAEGLAAGCGALRNRGLAPVAIGGLRIADAEACFRAGAESLAMVREIARSRQSAGLLWQAQKARWAARPPLRRGCGVVLAGSSGAGKSRLGRELARRLDLPFVDLDSAIVQREGKPIPEIFAEEGEASFREAEERLGIESLSRPCVLALGGGAWESGLLREAAASSAFMAMWLAETPVRCWERVAGDPGRPLATEREEFMARHRARMKHWSQLPCILPLGRSPERCAEALAAALD